MLYISVDKYIVTIIEGKDVIRYDLEKWLVQEDDGEWKPMKEADRRWVFHRYGVKPATDKQ